MGTVEFFKNMHLRLFVHTNATILYFDHHITLTVSRRDLQINVIAGVLNGIIHKVIYDIGKVHLICHDQRFFGQQVRCQCAVLLLNLYGETFRHLLNNIMYINGL
ncbi:hypothetical protein D3C80_1691860 [compost metagenome]